MSALLRCANFFYCCLRASIFLLVGLNSVILWEAADAVFFLPAVEKKIHPDAVSARNLAEPPRKCDKHFNMWWSLL